MPYAYEHDKICPSATDSLEELLCIYFDKLNDVNYYKWTNAQRHTTESELDYLNYKTSFNYKTNWEIWLWRARFDIRVFDIMLAVDKFPVEALLKTK
jgi:hypothetical protein